MKIKEVIVVEGKNDTKRLRSFFDVDTIETKGLGLSHETLDYIKEIKERRGIILFLDPDAPGEKIRRRINEVIPGCKNAFVMKEDARTKKKVGVEHASKEVLEEALNNLLTYEETEGTLNWEDFLEMGLSGREDSSLRREKIARAFHTGKCNAKTMYKRLNMMKITAEELEGVLR